MADKKISELNSLTGANAADGDLVAIVDVSATETKKITRSEFFTSIPSVDINGGTIDGTVIGGSTPAAISGTTITSTGGDLNLDTLDLNAIAASKAVTAVDVFVYDTSKDSDGGAWRKRTQHTSWYNETLNTATRGSRREFPAVAVIVAETNKVTIYDGDDPALPMWMVFTQNTNASALIREATITCVSALNGIISFGGNSGTAGIMSAHFIADFARKVRNAAQAGPTTTSLFGPLVNRNASTYLVGSNASLEIVNTTVNDVAMTVLPDAPIDPATGLPVPTIAVATAGGISVIRDDGNVWDITNYVQAPTAVEFVDIAGTQRIITQSRYASWSIILDIPTADISLVTAYFNRDVTTDPLNGTALHYASTGDDILVGKNVGLLRALSEPGIIGNGPADPDLRCDMKSTYNTGWMNGAHQGCLPV
jgi:trimeric autotransporter adhesin